MLGYLYSGDDSTISSGLLANFSGVANEETDTSLNSMSFRENDDGFLVAMVRDLAVLTMIHYLWLLLGSPFCTEIVVVSTNSTDQLKIREDITSANGPHAT